MTGDNTKKPNDILEEAIRQLREIPVPPGPAEAIRDTVLKAGAADVLPKFKATLVERIQAMKTMTKIAAALLIAAGIAVFIFTFAPGHKNIAFAEVVQPILTARTVVFNLSLGGEKENSQPVQIMSMGTSRIRQNLASGESIVIDFQEWKVLVLESAAKKAMIIKLDGLPQRPQNYLAMLINNINLTLQSPEVTIEELEEQQIGGRPAIGYHAYRGNLDMTVWADAETKMPVRLVSTFGQGKVAFSDFEFDVEMDESLFSMEIPEGYTLRETQFDLAHPTEEDLIEGLRLWANLYDGVFPPKLDMGQWQQSPDKIEGKMVAMKLSEEEMVQYALKVVRGILFTQGLKGQWVYNGYGVKLGDAETAVFWYQPEGAATYRVIYGDLTVEEVAPEDLPEPAAPTNEQAALYLPYQDYELVGKQNDNWHIIASGNIEAHTLLTLLKWPEDNGMMTIRFPYGAAKLQSVNFGEQAIGFSAAGEGAYELTIPFENFHQDNATITCIWTMPLETLGKNEYGYQVKLEFLIPVTYYKLTVTLDPDCGYINTHDPSQSEFVPFFSNSGTPTNVMGTCVLSIQKQEKP